MQPYVPNVHVPQLKLSYQHPQPPTPINNGPVYWSQHNYIPSQPQNHQIISSSVDKGNVIINPNVEQTRVLASPVRTSQQIHQTPFTTPQRIIQDPIFTPRTMNAPKFTV